MFVFRKVVSGKSLFKLSCVCLLLGKLVNGKYFPVNGKFGLVFRKIFVFYFERKTLSESCEKFKNAILFADYIKFDPQNFDCYIYIYIFFFFEKKISISSLRKVLIFIIVIFFFLLFFKWNFLSIKVSPHYFDCYLFYLK